MRWLTADRSSLPDIESEWNNTGGSILGRRWYYGRVNSGPDRWNQESAIPGGRIYSSRERVRVRFVLLPAMVNRGRRFPIMRQA